MFWVVLALTDSSLRFVTQLCLDFIFIAPSQRETPVNPRRLFGNLRVFFSTLFYCGFLVHRTRDQGIAHNKPATITNGPICSFLNLCFCLPSMWSRPHCIRYLKETVHQSWKAEQRGQCWPLIIWASLACPVLLQHGPVSMRTGSAKPSVLCVFAVATLHYFYLLVCHRGWFSTKQQKTLCLDENVLYVMSR